MMCAFGATASVAVAEDARIAALGQRDLREGSTGQDVRDLQRLLGKAGLAVERDGTFGAETTKAVRTFQSVTGLKVTGVADRATARLLQASTTSGASAANSGGFNRAIARRKSRTLGDRLPLRRGMSGRDVKMLQDFLRRAGVARVNVDGQFGTGTFRAVRGWELRAARAVNGVVDAGDAAALREQVGAVRGASVSDTPAAPAAPAPAAPAPPAPAQPAPGDTATINPDGTATAPASAPAPVKAIIAAANQIATKPYVYGGGHRADWRMDAGYDCSGSVSWALHGANLIAAPMPSGNFVGWGAAGPGQWVTVFAKGSHMYAVIAGLRFDTSGRSRAGTRWQADMRDAAGYSVRHPEGL